MSENHEINFHHDPQPPEGTETSQVTLMTPEGRKSIAVLSHALEGIDDPIYWLHVFEVRESEAPVIGAYVDGVFRWSTSPDCNSPDYLYRPDQSARAVTLTSGVEPDDPDSDLFRWIEVSGHIDQSYEIGQVASFLERNITDDAARLMVARTRHTPEGEHLETEVIVNSSLGNLRRD